MVALCRQCCAPLSVADLGHTLCLNCHWQHVFEYSDDPAHRGELRLTLVPTTHTGGQTARDPGNRLWQRVSGDGQAWCTLCGATVLDGWVQGAPGGLHTWVCAIHVDLLP
jgi:hypothetical protein